MTTSMDDAVRPPGLTAAGFEAALRAFASALGEGAALRSAEAVACAARSWSACAG